MKFLHFTIILLFTFLTSHAKKPEKLLLQAKEKAPYDAIIVPGVPYNDNFWTRVLEGRVKWAYYLYTQGITKNIIFSGSAVYTPYIESEIMAMMAIELGVPKHNVFTEKEAEHSIENVYYSNQIAKKMGFKKIALATDPFQSKMVQIPVKRMKIEIDYIPFVIDILEQLDIEQPEIDPKNAYVENFVSLEDREGRLERLRGTIGLKIELEE